VKLTRLDKSIKVFIGVLIINALIVAALFMLTHPDDRGQFVVEGKAMEMLQAFLFLSATVIGLVIFFWKKLWRHRLVYLGVPLLSLVSLLEEISWGYHIFSLYEPVWFMETRIDSLHDFIQIGTIILRDIGATFLGALAIGVVVLLVAGAVIYALVKYRAKLSPIAWMIVAFVLFVITSSFFDFNEPSTLITDFFEELADESAALSLLFANAMLWFVKPPETDTKTTETEKTEQPQTA
jgi:hypothetical protein